ncbi:MAG: hypothetical protein AB2A00_20130 [Myxococcota bacterium]
MWQDLNDANEALGGLVGARVKLGAEGRGNTARKQALLSSLYDLALWLRRWGGAMAGGDVLARKRWRLDNLFPGESKLKPGVEDIVDSAVTEPDDDLQDTVAAPASPSRRPVPA